VYRRQFPLQFIANQKPHGDCRLPTRSGTPIAEVRTKCTLDDGSAASGFTSNPGGNGDNSFGILIKRF
jgi:hypothetical protein